MAPALIDAQTAAPTCGTLLTAAELQKAVGAALEDVGNEEREPGSTVCSWMARGAGGIRTVAVEFYDRKAIANLTRAQVLDVGRGIAAP